MIERFSYRCLDCPTKIVRIAGPGRRKLRCQACRAKRIAAAQYQAGRRAIARRREKRSARRAD